MHNLRFSRMKMVLFSVGFTVLTLITLALVLSQKSFDNRSKAATSTQSTTTIVPKVFPTYVPGEVLVRFKQEPQLKTVSGQQAAPVVQNISSLSAGSLPSAIRALQGKTNVTQIEQVVKSLGSESTEISQLSSGKNVDTTQLLSVYRETKLNKLYLLRFDQTVSPDKIVQFLLSQPDVEIARPNYIYRTTLNIPSNVQTLLRQVVSKAPNVYAQSTYPNDPQFSQMWNHARAQAQQAWQVTKGNPNIVIALIDTGVHWNHEDLATNIWTNSDEVPNNGIDDDNNGYIDDIRGYDFVDLASTSDADPQEDSQIPDNDPSDFAGHGTMCAGIIAAVGNNGKGVVGVCPECKIMPLRAGYKTNQISTSGAMSESAIIQALYYAIENQANVINLSFGTEYQSQDIQSLINLAFSLRIISVAGSGNSNTDKRFYPAAYDNVIAVSTLTSTEVKADYSNYGYWVDVAAPAHMIPTTSSGNSPTSTSVGTSYMLGSGTSAGAPYISGAVGLLLSQNPSISSVNVLSRVTESVDRPSTNAPYVGRGRINLAKLVSPAPDSSVGILTPVNGSIVSGTTLIAPFAVGDITKWTLSLGNGNYPTNFEERATGQQITQGENPHSLDTRSLQEDAPTTIQMNASNTQGLSKSGYSTFITDNIQIKQPISFSSVSSASPINIMGNITSGMSYEISWGVGNAPTTWSTLGISTQRTGDVLANWNASSLAEGEYTLRIVVSFGTNRYEQYIRSLWLDKKLTNGFPIHIPIDQVATYEGVEEEPTLPIIGDITGDSKKEIIIVRNGHIPELRVYNSIGGLLWQKNLLTGGYENFNQNQPVVVDIDGNGKSEIILTQVNSTVPFTSQLTVYNGDGSVRFSKALPESIEPTFTVAELNADGKLEIIVRGFTETVGRFGRIQSLSLHILNDQGILIRTIPYSLGSNYNSSSGNLTRVFLEIPRPMVGNFDGDNDKEILIAETAQNVANPGVNDVVITVVNLDGTTVQGWPHRLSDLSSINPALVMPVITDINRDGKDDIVLGIHLKGIKILSHAGQVILSSALSDVLFQSSPSLANLNGDSTPEIIIDFFDNNQGKVKTTILTSTGQTLSGWPKDSNTNSGFYQKASPVVADITGDGLLDILTTSGTTEFSGESISNKKGKIFAWNISGAIIPGFPLTVETFTWPVMVTDLDGNGKTEVVASSMNNYDWTTSGSSGLKFTNSVYVWNLNSTYTLNTQVWPMYLHDTQWSSNLSPIQNGCLTSPLGSLANNETRVGDCGQNNCLATQRLRVFCGNGTVTKACRDVNSSPPVPSCAQATFPANCSSPLGTVPRGTSITSTSCGTDGCGTKQRLRVYCDPSGKLFLACRDQNSSPPAPQCN